MAKAYQRQWRISEMALAKIISAAIMARRTRCGASRISEIAKAAGGGEKIWQASAKAA